MTRAQAGKLLDTWEAAAQLLRARAAGTPEQADVKQEADRADAVVRDLRTGIARCPDGSPFYDLPQWDGLAGALLLALRGLQNEARGDSPS